MKPLKAEEIRGNWATLLSAWNADDSLDLGRVAAEIDALIGMRVDGIYSNGTAGEFHTQTEDEFDRISECLATKCNAAGMKFQIGVSHMSAQISRERLRRVVALAPGAVQVILPDWFPVTEEEAASFMERMAEVAGGIGLVLYNPPQAKRVWSPEQIGGLAERVPALIGLKTAGGDDAWYAAMRRHLACPLPRADDFQYDPAAPHPDPVTRSFPLARPQGPSLLRIPSAASQAAEVPFRRGGGDRQDTSGIGGAFRRLSPGFGISVFVPGHLLASGVQRGAQGAYSNVACLNPLAAQRWTEQIKSDLPGALEVEQRLRRFMDGWIAPFITEQKYCNAACDRFMALVGGWTDVGDRMRWPYRSIPRSEAERVRSAAQKLIPEFIQS